MPSMAHFILALAAVALVDGSTRVGGGSATNSNEGSSTSAPSLRNGRLPSETAATAVERQLLPHPPHHDHHDSSNYSGCLGLSEEELEEAWNFQGNAPPCTISVDGVVVAGDDETDGGSGTSGGGGLSGGGDGGDGLGDSTGDESDTGDDNGGESVSSSGESGSGGSGGSSSGSAGGSDGSSSSNGAGGSSGGGSGGDGDDSGSSAIVRFFNVSDCESYSNIWVWDLALTCENTTSLESCECTSASILHDEGALECPNDAGSPTCPDDCPVCSTCLTLLAPRMNCSDDTLQNDRSVGLEQDAFRAFPIVLGVAAVLAVALGATLYQNKQRGLSGGLDAGLVPPANSML